MREIGLWCASALAWLTCTPFAWANDVEKPAIRSQTFGYKRVGDLAIHADVHRADDDALRPVVVWIHGGGLINGHRAQIDRRVRGMMLEGGYVLVSIDYRLAPETKLAGIIEDVEDALAWVRKDGERLFRGATERIAVMGGSAGGYLTLTAGYRARPRPTVLVAFWGYGDLIGDWYSQPSPHPRHNRIKVDRATALREVSGPPIADSRERNGNGSTFYQYCRQTGRWPIEVSGWDPRTEADRYTPYLPVRNVTADYPPTLLIHGTNDTDVPFEQSTMMAELFAAHGVDHRLIAIPDAEHGLAGGDPQHIDGAYTAVRAFVDRHMKP